jgi:hypothetical protein
MLSIHSQAINIDGPEQLHLAIQLADYYRALPILSQALSASLLGSSLLLSSISEHCCGLLSDAYKLRIAILFRECLVHASGPWTMPRYRKITGPKLRRVCDAARNKISSNLNVVHYHLLHYSTSIPEVGPSMMKAAKLASKNGEQLIHPVYFRTLMDTGYTSKNSIIVETLGMLMRSTLVLDRSGHEAGRVGIFRDFFLSLDTGDDDLTWDTTEK